MVLIPQQVRLVVISLKISLLRSQVLETVVLHVEILFWVVV